MESWRLVWRDGFAPVISTDRLVAIRDALRDDDPRLIQGQTASPVPLSVPPTTEAKAACVLGLCAFVGGGPTTTGHVEHVFAALCFDADQRLGEPAACRWFLNWFDDTPRAEMRRELLAEVELVLAGRAK
ncbi:hypothetical protein [Gemmata sp.]|uniref:hypothetical protein n=1 Tax=Gemmata sp. TaxID=1914242 RepID=UPI003F6F30FD